MSDRLSAQGRPDPRGRTLLFLVSKQNLNLPIGTFGTLKIIKNGVELKKLRPPKIEVVKN